MGIPPTGCQLIDHRAQYWPSFDEPVECFLFRFEYRLGSAQFSNIGIVGPLTHAFSADLSDLSLDDMYAAFAGWQAEHDEIYESACEDLNEAQRIDAARLERRLTDSGFESIEPIQLGSFFGERVLVARAQRSGNAGHVSVDARELLWHPHGDKLRPLGPEEVWSIHKGRKLLRMFNPESSQ